MGDGPQTFEEFFEAERARLFKALCAITGSRAEAEDLAQDALIKVWERWDTVGALDDPAGYLHRTAMNLFRDRYRRAAVAVRRAVRLAPAPDAYEAVEARHEAARILGPLSPGSGPPSSSPRGSDTRPRRPVGSSASRARPFARCTFRRARR